MTALPPDPHEQNHPQPGYGYPPPAGWPTQPPQAPGYYGNQPPQMPPPPGYPPQYVAGPPPKPAYWPKLIVSLVASIGICIGSLGPWMTFLAISRAGVDGDGVITLILGAISSVGLFTLISRNGRPKYGDRWAGPVVGALCLIVSIPSAVEVADRTTEIMGETVGPSIGWGLWLVIVAAGVLCLASFDVAQQIGKERKQAAGR